jgi:hypothetical protein
MALKALARLSFALWRGYGGSGLFFADGSSTAK